MKAAILFAAAVLAAPVAHAESSSARLEFHRGQGAETCPDRDAFEAAVASRMGSSPWSLTATRLVRILFSSDGAKVSGRMELLAGGAVLGTRTVRSESSDCHELAESLALGVALTLHRPIAISQEPEQPQRASESVPRPTRGAPIPVTLHAVSEGGYSFWSSAERHDDHVQSAVWSGDLAAGGEAMFAPGYSLDVLVAGYGAERRDRRRFTDAERFGRADYEGGVYSRRQSVGATVMRAAVRADGEDGALSLGLLVGGFERSDCHDTRTSEWQSALCSDLRHFATFPTFGARIGPESGPYVTAGFLDTRFPAGEIAHLGVGAIVRGNRRVDTSVVAAMEGVGARLQLELPIGRQYVLLPALSSGILYDTFDVGGSNVWVRAGCGVALRL